MPKAILESKYFASARHALNHLEYLDRQSTLFSGTADVPVQEALAAAQKSKSIKWRLVYSLKQEDVDRLEIDRDYMQQLVQNQKETWARAYNIPPEHLNVFASYHPVNHHPHLHIVMFGQTASDGYVLKQSGQTLGAAFKRSRETVKSAITNEIFAGDMESVYRQKSEMRAQANQQLERLLQELGSSKHPVPSAWAKELKALGQQVQQLPGKHVYGYLPPEIKQQVDAFLARAYKSDPVLKQIVDRYQQAQKEIITELYAKKPDVLAEKMAAFEQAFLHPQKGQDTQRHNLVIQAAERLTTPSKAVDHAKQQTLQKENPIVEKPPANVKENPTQYTEKSPGATVRQLLFALGRSCTSAAQRMDQRGRQRPQAKKFRRRKRHLTHKEQINQIDR